MLPEKATDDKRAGIFRANVEIDGVMRNERPKRLAVEPRTWWQRVVAGERLPKRLFRHPKCEGTIEDHRMIALDVRELIRKHVFDQPAGSAFPLNLAYPWLRVMRLNSSSLDLQLVTGRIVVVPLVWASCGAMGERIRIECPLCSTHLHTPLCRWKSRVSALQWSLVCGAAHQRQRPEVPGDEKRSPQAGRLWSILGSRGPTKAARHVAADVRSALCGVGPHQTRVIRLAARACSPGCLTAAVRLLR